MEMRGLLAFHGYANFLVELLRAGGLSLDDYPKVLSPFSPTSSNTGTSPASSARSCSQW